MADDMLKEDGTLNTDRYYYRPGTTEPEMRPEFASEAAAASASTTAPAAGEAEAEQRPLRGPLPEDFPGHGALENAGLTTYAKVRKNLDTLEELDGIGPATADKIREAMNESNPEEEEEEEE